MESIKRNTTIDALKGFAIILVVLGHCIQWYVSNYDDNIVYRIIYSFHMPLFFFLSGYVYKLNSNKVNFLVFIKKKFVNLLLPFLIWYFISYVVLEKYETTSLHTYYLKLFSSPDVGLWFLWVLFWMFFIVKTIENTNLKYIILIIPFIVIFGLKNIMGIKLLILYFPYFLIGYFLKTYKERIIRKIFDNNYIKIILVLSFGLMLVFWNRHEPYFIPFLKTLNIPGLKFIEIGYKYITASLGIYLCIVLFKYLKNYKFYGYISMIGLYSLDIYVSHQIIFNIISKESLYFPNILLQIIIVIIFTTLVFFSSFYLSNLILRRYKVTRITTLGMLN